MLARSGLLFHPLVKEATAFAVAAPDTLDIGTVRVPLAPHPRTEQIGAGLVQSLAAALVETLVRLTLGQVMAVGLIVR